MNKKNKALFLKKIKYYYLKYAYLKETQKVTTGLIQLIFDINLKNVVFFLSVFYNIYDYLREIP